jgi:mRNA interferase HigB
MLGDGGGVATRIARGHAEVEKASWKDPSELKAQFGSTSVISSESVVFNIKGNDYRLVVAINYHYQILLIIWLSTHEEYDEIGVAKVTFEKERYADSSNSN